MSTFEEVWRRARLEMPAVPALLVRAWVQDAFNDLCDRWGWAFLRAEGTLVTKAARSLSITLTEGSTTITSVGLFLSTDAGRQLRLARLPVYTIISVTNANTAILDRAYTEDTATTSVTIYDGYATLPADFRRFLAIYDRYNQRTLPFWLSEDELAVADPGRVFSDSYPRYLVPISFSPATATLGQVRYEYWPSPTSARTYPFLYIRSAQTLVDSATLPGVLSTRGDVLRNYVLARAALWPGTTDQKNPGYSPATASVYQTAWETGVQQLTLSDDNEYSQQLMATHWTRRMGGIAPSSTLLRQTDATTSDYY